MTEISGAVSVAAKRLEASGCGDRFAYLRNHHEIGNGNYETVYLAVSTT